MTSRRTVDSDLRRALRQPSFPPGRRDLPALFELLGEEEVAEDVERALLRVGAEAFAQAEARLSTATAPLRGRLARVSGRLAQAGDARARARLIDLLDDADAKTRRNAVLFLGRVRAPEVEEALLRRWQVETRPDHRRSLAEALGKIGGERARAALHEATATEDPGVAETVELARLRLERTVARAGGAESRIDLSRHPPGPLVARLHCRAGLEPILVEELEGLGLTPKPAGPAMVEVPLAAPPERLFAARTFLQLGFVLPEAPDVAAALTSDAARALLTAFTAPLPVRYRIAFAAGGHRRAAVYAAARDVAARAPELVNDPTRSTWEVVVHEPRPGAVLLELVPRRAEDPRFLWRKGDVPAASHPTIAAALARVAGVRADDVVWDPFVGSAGELVERALLGPYAALHGSDTDPRALEIAARNLQAAGVRDAQLVRADATTHAPRGVTLILTNPPMGRRVARGQAVALLEAFLDHAARVLVDAGRLVWLSPFPDRGERVLRAAGLEVAVRRQVDLGGFGAELQVVTRTRARPRAERGASGRARPGTRPRRR